MDFKSLVSFGQKKEINKKYLAIRIGTQSVTGVVWEVLSGKVELGKLVHLPVTSTKIEDFLPVADKVVTAVILGVIPEPKEVLFGLPPDWVAEGKIIEPYLTLLRQTSKELSLTPLGFVVLPEAIANYYKELEGTPLTAITVGIEVSKLYVTYIRAGKVLKTEVVNIIDSSDLNSLIEGALKKFTEVEVLPSRILIYDGGEDLEILKNQILSYPWTQKMPFLHFPKVEPVVDADVAKAVAIAGGTEMGGTVEPVVNEVPVVAKIDEQVKNETENVVPVDEEVVDTGFTVDKDIKEEATKPKFKLNFTDLKNKIPAMPKFNINLSGKLPLIIGVFIISLLIAVVGGYFALLNLVLKNQVVVTVNSKTIENQKDITVVTAGEVSDSDLKLLANKIETEAIGSKRGVVTGKKIVGEKAKGSITIYGTTLGRTFAAGTVVTGSGLKFIMDNSVTIATGSAASSATATVSVTASGIGDSFNVSPGTLFEIGDYPQSSYQGKTDTAFTGGSSHQVLVVTKQDQDRLLATLSAELSQKGLEDLRAKVPSGQNLLENALATAVTLKKFDREIDTEADSVGLTMTVKVTGVTVEEKQLIAKMGNLSSSDIPPDYDFDISRASVSVLGSKVDKSGNVILTVNFSAKLLPKIDRSKIIKDLTGKNYQAAKDYLTKTGIVVDSKIISTPQFLDGLKTLSPNQKNIGLEIISL